MEPLSADDPRMIGEFRLHARLGAGGMGQVYLGFSPAGRAVAIKVVHPQLARDQEFLQRFSREVAAARSVSGMYTAPVVGSGLNDSPPWLATAYVPGPPLAAVVARYGALPEPAVWRLAAGLAEALRAVHAAGLVHRDLKPANVLLADDGPHVIDFGISRAFQGTQLTSAGMVVGTPGYMSPEQAEGAPSGPPSDVFSLGCVLAYTATGSPPFGEGSAATILYRVVRKEPDLGKVPASLRQLIEACLRKDAAQRPDLTQLIGMIAALGPATAVSLGSFWPEAVARVIATEQASQTPTGLTPPGQAARIRRGGDQRHDRLGRPGAAPAGRADPDGPGDPARAGLGRHRSRADDLGRLLRGRGAAQGHPEPGARHAVAGPADLRRAAARRSDGHRVSRPGIRRISRPVHRGHRRRTLPGAVPLAPVAAAAGRRGLLARGRRPGRPRRPGRARPVPAGTAEPGRRGDPRRRARRDPADVRRPDGHRGRPGRQPGELGTYARAATFDKKALPRRGHETLQNHMAGLMALAVVTDVVGIACWVMLAIACRRGRGWTRVTASVLLGVYTVVLLLVLVGTHNDPGARFFSLLVWVLGVAAVIPLWTRQAHDFFATWGKH